MWLRLPKAPHPSRLFAEETAYLLGERFGLFEGGEVAAALHLAPAIDVKKRSASFFGGFADILGKQCEPAALARSCSNSVGTADGERCPGIKALSLGNCPFPVAEIFPPRFVARPVTTAVFRHPRTRLAELAVGLCYPTGQ